MKVFSFEIRPVSAQQASPSCLKRRDSCPASASDICPVSTADVCPVSTAQASVQFCSKQLLATCTLTLVPQLLSAFLQFCFFHTMPELTFSLQRCFFLWRYHTQTSHTLREVFSSWRLEVLWKMWIRSTLLGLATLIVTKKPHPRSASQMIIQHGTGMIISDGRSTFAGCRHGGHQPRHQRHLSRRIVFLKNHFL